VRPCAPLRPQHFAAGGCNDEVVDFDLKGDRHGSLNYRDGEQYYDDRDDNQNAVRDLLNPICQFVSPFQLVDLRASQGFAR
jgi:hypothetical protein